ncbi:MAG TPA: polyprenyl synthetase family protein [Thermoguttaceae bacterium]|nr:polyprenyl synthetase family protein [Thermoguttaceae bacterium]
MSVAEEERDPPRFEAEHAHPACAVEWWFFQGHYEGPLSGRRHFMAVLFRSNLEVRDGGQANGFQLLLAVLDPSARDGRHVSSTWIDPRLLDKTVEKLKTSDPHVDPVVQRAFLEAIEKDGPPEPILLCDLPETFEAAPLRMQWGKFALVESEAGFDLTFREPGAERLVSLHLSATSPRMDVECAADVVPLGEGMAYHAYPRVRLRGRLDSGEELHGQAWMDHQWGDVDWFHDEGSGVTLGWDWFGINLDDGSDMLVMRHRDARSGRVVGMHATLREPGGEPTTMHELTLTPLRHWNSPTNFITYPVAWRIDVPGFDASLVFEPECDDQEIMSFGTMRAVWEGVGRISGTIRGAVVRGVARGEFHGYGYVFDHEDFVRTMGSRVDRHLEEFFPRRFDAATVEKFVGPAHWRHEVDAYTEMLAVPVWDLIDRSGKRWRPILGILLLESLGVRSGPYEGLISCMLELIHAGALIVDDVEDNSLLRRGQECLHLRYGLDVAINAGNSLYFLPGHAIIAHPLLSTEKRRRWLEIKERICIEAHCGQSIDIFWSRQMTRENLQRMLDDDVESKILQMYEFKTASAAKGAAEFVAVIADASPEVTRACVDFGRMLGVAYQIVDDIHNFSRSPDWTKVTGEDLANGKLTFVIARALRRLDAAESERLGTIFCSPELRGDPSTLEEGIDLVFRSGALDASRETAKEMVNNAWDEFRSCVPPSGPKIMLHTMCLKLIDLAYDG